MNLNKNDRWIQATIIAVAALLFIPFLGRVHLFDWDEINFAEAAREMLVSRNWLTVQINFHPFWEKPPLFIWFQALSMKIFGINEFAARFPDAVCGVITLLVLFRFGRKIVNREFGLFWAAFYGGSILPFFYFKSGIIDPWFNLFIFLGIVHAYLYLSEKNNKKKLIHACLAALFTGMAVLTKGPVGLLIFGLTVLLYLIIRKSWKDLRISHMSLAAVIFIIIGGMWFILLVVTGHTGTIQAFIDYNIRLFQTKDAGHGGFLFYHFVVLFLGVFPASVFFFHRYCIISREPVENYRSFRTLMLILFWTVLILFTIVKTKIVHYSSMCYFPLAFLAAYVTYRLKADKMDMPLWMKNTILALAILWGLLEGSLILVDRYKDKIISSHIIKDDFAMGNLQAHVPWSGFEFLIGLFLIVGSIYVLYFLKGGIGKKVYAMLAITTVFTYSTAFFIVPKIEGYSQRAAIEFYRDHAGRNCYMETLGFKSYAQLYYFRKPEYSNPESDSLEWLLHGNIDKPVYFVMKNTASAYYLKKYPQLVPLYSKNGFVFAERKPSEMNSD